MQFNIINYCECVIQPSLDFKLFYLSTCNKLEYIKYTYINIEISSLRGENLQEGVYNNLPSLPKYVHITSI